MYEELGKITKAFTIKNFHQAISIIDELVELYDQNDIFSAISAHEDKAVILDFLCSLDSRQMQYFKINFIKYSIENEDLITLKLMGEKGFDFNLMHFLDEIGTNIESPLYTALKFYNKKIVQYIKSITDQSISTPCVFIAIENAIWNKHQDVVKKPRPTQTEAQAKATETKLAEEPQVKSSTNDEIIQSMLHRLTIKFEQDILTLKKLIFIAIEARSVDSFAALLSELEKSSGKITLEERVSFIKHNLAYGIEEIDSIILDIPKLRTLPKVEKSKILCLLARMGNTSTFEYLLSTKQFSVNMENESNNTALHHAVLANKPRMVEFLISKGANLDLINIDKNTPLFLALKNERFDIAYSLVEAGANLTIENKDGLLPIDLIINSTDPSFIFTSKILLDAAKDRASIKPIFVGYDLLQYVIVKGHEDMAFDLLASGKYNPSSLDIHGNNALMLAIKHKCFKLALKLINDGVVGIYDVNRHKESALTLAIKNSNPEIAILLIEKGADVNFVDSEGNTPLLLSEIIRQKELAKFILSCGVDILATNHAGQNLFSITIKNDDLEQLKYYESKFISLSSQFFTDLLIEASSNLKHSVFEYLLTKTDINTYGSELLTPLTYAITQCNSRVYNFLLERGADIATKDGHGNTALHAAIQSDFIVNIRKLLEFTSIDEVNKRGETPLILAIKNNKLLIAKDLIDWGADVNLADIEGNQAIHYAASNNYLDIIKLLISAGSDLYATNILDQSALDLIDTKTEYDEYFEPSSKSLISTVQNNLHKDQSLIYLAAHKYKDQPVFQGQTLLQYQISKNNISVAVKLIEQYGLNIESRDIEGNTALLTAMQMERLDAVDLLINKYKANLSVHNNHHKTPVMIAAQKGYMDMIVEWFHKAVNIYYTSPSGENALTYAIQAEHLDIIEFLINRGQSLSFPKEGAKSVLDVTLNKGNIELFKVYVDRYISLYKTCPFFNDVLINAICSHNEEAAQYLLDKIGIKEGTKIKNALGARAMVAAAKQSNVMGVELALKLGFDINATYKGDTALMILARAGKSDSMQFLIQRGANLNFKNASGETPLVIAIKNHDLELTDYLHGCGVDIHSKSSKEDEYPIEVAASHGALEIVSYICSRQVKSKITNQSNAAAFIAASANGCLEVVNFFLESDIFDLNTKYKGSHALFAAIESDNEEIAEAIVNSTKVNVDLKDASGNTPLMRATHFNHIELVKVLINHSASVNSNNMEGISPLDIAVFKGHLEVATHLLQNGAYIYNQDTLQISALLKCLGLDVVNNKLEFRDFDNQGFIDAIFEHGAIGTCSDLYQELSLILTSYKGPVALYRAVVSKFKHNVENIKNISLGNFVKLSLSNTENDKSGQKIVSVLTEMAKKLIGKVVLPDNMAEIARAFDVLSTKLTTHQMSKLAEIILQHSNDNYLAIPKGLMRDILLTIKCAQDDGILAQIPLAVTKQHMDKTFGILADCRTQERGFKDDLGKIESYFNMLNELLDGLSSSEKYFYTETDKYHNFLENYRYLIELKDLAPDLLTNAMTTANVLKKSLNSKTLSRESAQEIATKKAKFEIDSQRIIKLCKSFGIFENECITLKSDKEAISRLYDSHTSLKKSATRSKIVSSEEESKVDLSSTTKTPTKKEISQAQTNKDASVEEISLSFSEILSAFAKGKFEVLEINKKKITIKALLSSEFSMWSTKSSAKTTAAFESKINEEVRKYQTTIIQNKKFLVHKLDKKLSDILNNICEAKKLDEIKFLWCCFKKCSKTDEIFEYIQTQMNSLDDRATYISSLSKAESCFEILKIDFVSALAESNDQIQKATTVLEKEAHELHLSTAMDQVLNIRAIDQSELNNLLTKMGYVVVHGDNSNVYKTFYKHPTKDKIFITSHNIHGKDSYNAHINHIARVKAMLIYDKIYESDNAVDEDNDIAQLDSILDDISIFGPIPEEFRDDSPPPHTCDITDYSAPERGARSFEEEAAAGAGMQCDDSASEHKETEEKSIGDIPQSFIDLSMATAEHLHAVGCFEASDDVHLTGHGSVITNDGYAGIC